MGLFFALQSFSKPSQVAQTLAEMRDPNSSTVLIAAHRGGYENDVADQAPENSVANILNCQSKGIDLYETDIQRTKDGVFVMAHDPTIDRETTGTGSVKDMTLAELKQLKKKYRNGSVSNERMATFEEFLQQGKGHIIFKIDLKPGVNAYFKEIMDLVVKHDMVNSVIFRLPYSDADRFAQYKADGVPYTKSLLMFKVKKIKQVDDIITRFDPLTIQVDVKKDDPANPKTLKVIQYATRKGLLVETHAEKGEKEWAQLVDAGVRMFHTKEASKVQTFLKKCN
jgi:glycerophosphoryl diester phosphodiesterase